MKVLVLGHWDLSAQDVSGVSDTSGEALRFLAAQPDGAGPAGLNLRALRSLVTGLRLGAERLGVGRDVWLRALPFGPASAFSEALAEGGPASGSFRSLVAGRREASTIGIGSELRDAANGTDADPDSGPFRGTVVVEGGHSWSHDWGMGMLGALAGEPGLSLGSSVAALESALERARNVLSDQTVVVAASSSRPLLGAGGTAHLDPALNRRVAGPGSEAVSPGGTSATGSHHGQASSEQIATWRDLLMQAQRRTRGSVLPLGLASGAPSASSLGVLAGPLAAAPLSGLGDPTGVPGSGVAAGAAAVLAALGVPIRETWDVLATVLDLRKIVGEADLVVALEPHLDAPGLSDSALRQTCEIAALDGTPVVAVGAQSSLSSPEKADLGLHGLSLLAPVGGRRFGGDTPVGDPFLDAGRRVAQTWLRQ